MGQQVDPHGQVEIQLAAAAHHRGEVEDADVPAVHQAPDRRLVGDLAGGEAHPRVEPRRALGGDRHVEELDGVDPCRPAVGTRDLPRLYQPAGEQGADETGAAGDDDLHERASRFPPTDPATAVRL